MLENRTRNRFGLFITHSSFIVVTKRKKSFCSEINDSYSAGMTQRFQTEIFSIRSKYFKIAVLIGISPLYFIMNRKKSDRHIWIYHTEWPFISLHDRPHFFKFLMTRNSNIVIDSNSIWNKFGCSFQILFRESIRMVCFRISCFKFLRENMNLGELSNWCFESSLWLADFKKCDYRGGPIMSANLIMIGTKYECKLHNRRDQIRVQTWSQCGPNMSANLIPKGTRYECKLGHKRD